MKVRNLRKRFYRKTGGPRGIGLRHPYFAGCIGCESYRFLDEYGRFPTFDEASAICDEISHSKYLAALGAGKIAPDAPAVPQEAQPGLSKEAMD